VTSLEYSQNLVSKLAARGRASDKQHDSAGVHDVRRGRNDGVVCGDAAALPFRSETFSAVIAVLMLHHMRTREAQDQALRESFRVLQPGGVFLALEIENSWLHRIAHIRSTFVPFARDEVPARFSAAGFIRISVAERSGAFRMKVHRPSDIGD
jgi:ubiquinone/menaquinone biosynthesis C-methylase UbiE